MIRGRQREVTATVRSISTWILSLPTSFRLGILVIVLASLVGGVRTAAGVVMQVADGRTPEYTRRVEDWSWTYAFANKCATSMFPRAHIVFVNPVVGSGDQVPDVLEFDPDASEFAYPLHPRSVAVKWDLASLWIPQPDETDYVALWSAAGFRSAAARAAAADEEAMLRTTYPSGLVCSYADGEGDHGVVYAVSQAAVAATSAEPAEVVQPDLARPYGSLASLLKAYLGLASLVAIGLLIVSTLVPQGLPRSLRVALAFPVGCLAAVLELAVFSLLGLSWSFAALAIPNIVLAGALLAMQGDLRLQLVSVLRSLRGLPGQVQNEVQNVTWSLDLTGLALLVVVVMCLMVAAPFGLPVTDGFSSGYSKALMFWVDGSILNFYQRAQDLFYSQPTHPPFVALLINWLYLAIGGVDEHATLILWPAMFGAIVATVYATTRSFVSRRAALWATLVVVLAASDVTDAVNHFGYADLPLAMFLLAGVGAIWLWAARSNLSWRLAVLGMALLAGAAWTKEEGIVSGPVALVVLTVVATQRWRAGMKGAWRAPVLGALVFLLVVAPIGYLRAAYPAPEVIVHASGLGNAGSRLPVIVVGFAARAVQHWYMPLALVGLGLWWLRPRRTGVPLPGALILAVIVVVQLGADGAGIAVNTFEVHDEMSWAAGRLVTQLSPVVFVGALALWCVLIAQAGGHANAREDSGRRRP